MRRRQLDGDARVAHTPTRERDRRRRARDTRVILGRASRGDDGRAVDDDDGRATRRWILIFEISNRRARRFGKRADANDEDGSRDGGGG
jgi:hypothetical protein